MSEDLKPCPFCGGEAEYHCDSEMVKVRCAKYDCGAHLNSWFDEPEDAAAAWNKRVELVNKLNAGIAIYRKYEFTECDCLTLGGVVEFSKQRGCPNYVANEKAFCKFCQRADHYGHPVPDFTTWYTMLCEFKREGSK